MRLAILLLAGLFFALPTALAQPGHRHRPARYSYNKSHHANPYILSNRVFLKWIPSAFLRLPESVVRVGAEYCFAKYFGFGVEGGPVLSRPRSAPNRSKATGGFDLHLEPRFYFSRHPHTRGFVAVQGFRRTMNYDSGYVSAYNKYGDITSFSQSSALATITGVGITMGFVTHMGSGLHFELSAGAGSKNVHIERQQMTTASYPQNSSALFLKESDVLADDDLPYIIIDLKFSGLLGGKK